MRRRDLQQRFRRRIFVDQGAAAAVDLNIDESRREQPSAEVALHAASRPLFMSNDGLYARPVQDERPIVEKMGAIEQARAGQHEHHTVSVTLRKWRGLSGSRPNRRATASTRR